MVATRIQGEVQSMVDSSYYDVKARAAKPGYEARRVRQLRKVMVLCCIHSDGSMD